jgi:hypothetical protein
MSKIDAVWVGPPADFTEQPKGYDKGRPVFEVGEHEAVQSANWEPQSKVSKARADRLAAEQTIGVTADDNPPEPAEQPEGADA